jgi:nucleotide-binding universal stress UspA family protein
MTRRTIMVALDGSDKDARAVAAGRAIGRLSQCDLHFVRVVGEDVLTSDHLDAEAHLASVVTGLPPANLVATSALREAKDTAAALIEQARGSAVVMVVLATRAPGARSRALVGSVADQVMRECPRPVVLVPPGAAFLAETHPTISRVLVPMDDSSLSFRAVEFIVALLQPTHPAFMLAEVVADDHAGATALVRLEQSAAWMRSRGAKDVEVTVLQSSDIAAAITGAVREWRADAIVMSTHGAGGLGRLMLGSVAEQVVRRSEVPVMLLTPGVLAPA